MRQFVQSLLPTDQEALLAALVEAGDETALRQALELDPGHGGAIVALAELLVRSGRPEAADEALALLARIPESDETRRVAALARMGADGLATFDSEVEGRLDALLDRVKDDEEARQEFLDALELLGADDPRTASYRKKLTSRLF